MAIEYIKVNTNSLASDASELKDQLNMAKSNLDKMFESVVALDGMWDGPANDAFNAQFRNDYDSFKEICQIVEDLMNDMTDASQKYDSCENEIYSIVASLKI